MELLNVKNHLQVKTILTHQANASPLILLDCHSFATICHDNHPRSRKPPMWCLAGFWGGMTYNKKNTHHMWFISISNSNSNILERFGIHKCAWKKYCFWSKVSLSMFEFSLFHGNQWFNSRPLIRPYLLEGIALGGVYLRFP